LLKHARIDLIQFPRGAELFDLLVRRGYTIYGIQGEQMAPLARAEDGLAFSHFLAIHQRLLPLFANRPRSRIDIATTLREHGLEANAAVISLEPGERPVGLERVQMLRVFVSFDGSPAIEEMDALLEAQGFVRVGLTSPTDALRADAAYIRRKLP
jgi:hypothetical protein